MAGLSKTYTVGIEATVSDDASRKLAAIDNRIEGIAGSARDAGDALGIYFSEKARAARVEVESLQRQMQAAAKNLQNAKSSGDRTYLSGATENYEETATALRKAKAASEAADESLRKYREGWASLGDVAQESGEKAVASMKDARDEADGLGGALGKLGRMAAAAFTLDKAVEFAKKASQVRGEMQQLEIAFSTMLGSKEKADALIQDAVQFAATTPFDLQGVASGAKQLLAYGTAAEDIIDDMRMLGSVAAGLSIPLNDLIYLYGTLRSQGKVMTIDIRQFAQRGIPIYEELAKVLGTTTSKVNEMVSAGKVGFEDVEKVFRNLTTEGGKFAGLMDGQASTISGRISNIGDSIYQMFNEIGKKSEGVINGALSVAATLIDNYETVGRIIAGLVTTYGAYKAAVIVAGAAETLAAKQASAAALIRLVRIKAVTKAQALLNATMLANPYVLATTAVVGLSAAIFGLSKRMADGAQGVKSFNRYIEEQDRLLQERASAADDLLKTARDESKSTEERKSALEALQKAYPGILDKYDLEKLALADILKLKADIANYDLKTSFEADLKQLDKIDKSIERLEKAPKNYSGPMGAADEMGNANALAQLRKERALLEERIGSSMYDIFRDGPQKPAPLPKEEVTELTEEQKKAIKKAREAMLSEVDDLSKAAAQAVENADVFGLQTAAEKIARDTAKVDASIDKSEKQVTKKIAAMYAKLTGGDATGKNLKWLSENGPKEVSAAAREAMKYLATMRGINAENAEMKTRNAAFDFLSGLGSSKEGKKKLEQEISSTLSVLDEGEREIGQKWADMLLAEYEFNNATNKSLEERRKLYKQLQEARLAEWEALHPDASDAEKDNYKANLKFELESWDLSQIVDYGKVDDVIQAISAKWNAFAQTLPAEMREKVFKAMDADLVSYLEKNSVDFDIFVNRIGRMSLQKLERMLSDSEARLAAAGKDGSGDTLKLRAEIQALRNRIKELNRENKSQVVSWNDINSVISQSIAAFEKLGTVLGETDSEAVAALGDMASASLAIANGVDAIKKATSALEKATAILAIISAAIQLVSVVVGVFNDIDESAKAAASAAWEYAKAIEEARYQAELLGNTTIFGEDKWGQFITNADRAREALKKFREEQGAQRRGQTISTPGGNFNVRGDVWTADMRSWWEKNISHRGQEKIVTKTINDFLDSDGNLMYDELKAYYETYSEGLSDASKRNIERLLADWEAYKEAADEMKSYLTDIFGELGDSLGDALLDAFENGTDAAAAFGDAVSDVVRNLVKQMAYATFIAPVMKKAQDAIEKIMGSDLSDEEKYEKSLNALSALIGEIPGLQEKINDYYEKAYGAAEEHGIDLSSGTERSAATTGFASMSQDSADELNGRFTAIQGYVYEINVAVATLQSQNARMVENASLILLEVMGIHSDTTEMNGRLETIEGGVSSLRGAVDTIVREGVRMTA